MKKKDFVTLVLSVLGLLVFGIGMCMCLLPEWNMFKEGCIFGAVGFIILIAMIIVRRKMEGKSLKINLRVVGYILYGIVSSCVFGLGLSMAILSEGKMIIGILIGIVGILLLLGLIPLVKGFED